MALSHHGLAPMTFRPAPTRTADLTHAVLLQDAVPQTQTGCYPKTAELQSADAG